MSNLVSASRRSQILARGIPLVGSDIDTDRILPGRYLKSVTFDGLGKHVFEDERRQSPGHSFDNPAFRGAAVLIVAENFGCGSSREHAPRGLRDWGIQAIVGISFAEIFLSNCTAIGVPCLTLAMDDVIWLQSEIQRHPEELVLVEVDLLEVRFLDRVLSAAMHPGARQQLLTGSWDATATLLEANDAIEAAARRLPYFAGF